MVLAAARKHRLHKLTLDLGGEGGVEAKSLMVAVRTYTGA